MSKSVNGETEPWIVVSWLRDHLLLPRERKDPALWKKVTSILYCPDSILSLLFWLGKKRYRRYL